MIKRLKACLPTVTQLQTSRWASWLHPLLKKSPAYWKFTRHSCARAALIGCFNALMPIPFQTMLALMMAIPLRANLVVTMALLWINNPFTIIPLYFFGYQIGAMLLHEPLQAIPPHLSWAWFATLLQVNWRPFLLGCSVCGFVLGIVAYGGVLLFWRNKKTIPQG